MKYTKYIKLIICHFFVTFWLVYLKGVLNIMRRTLIASILGCLSVFPAGAIETVQHGKHCALLHNDTDFSQSYDKLQFNELSVFNQVEKVLSSCQGDHCLSGAGTESDPYILSVSAHYSEDAASRFSVKEIERIAKEGVDNFNAALINSSIYTLKAEFVELVEIPSTTFDFVDTVGADTTRYYYGIPIEKERAYGSDFTLIFHDWTNQSALYGLTGIASTYAAINLAAIVIDELPKTIVHEMGHMMGSGHQLGTTTSGGEFNYSNAIYCERDDGSRLGSIVSAIEHSSKVLQFSSPDMECGEEGVTDNRQTIIELSAQQANYNTVPEIKGNVSFSINTQSISEGDSIEVTLVRDGDISDYAFVGLWLESDNLVPHVNYKGAEYRYIEFQKGEDTVTLNIETIVDGQWNAESSSLSLRMDYPTGLILANEDSIDVAVGDIDEQQKGYVSLAVEKLNVTEGESVDIVLNRLDGVDGELSVLLSTGVDTANASHFNAINETITFLDGETQKTISLETLADGVYSDTVVTLTVSIAGDVDGLTQTNVSILNSDPKPAKEKEETESSGGSLGIGVLFLLALFGVRRFSFN